MLISANAGFKTLRSEKLRQRETGKKKMKVCFVSQLRFSLNSYFPPPLTACEDLLSCAIIDAAPKKYENATTAGHCFGCSQNVFRPREYRFPRV